MKKTTKIKQTLCHMLWLGAAAMLMTAGVISLLGTDAEAPGVWAGGLMLLSGAAQMTISRLMRRNVFGDRSFFSKGMMAVATGALVLCGSFISREVLRALVSMMTLMAGVNLFTAGLVMQADRVQGRWLLIAAAALEVLLGAAGFLRPELLGLLAEPITGVSLLYEGLAVLLTWHMGMKWLHSTQKAAA